MFSDTVEIGRRSLLKLSPFAVATAATTFGHVALAEAPASTMVEAIFNVRSFGATGDGKTVDTPAINRAIEAVAVAGGVLLSSSLAHTCASLSVCATTWIYIFHEDA